MLTMNKKLQELYELGKDIKVSIVGAGKMGKGLIDQLTRIKGMIPALVVNRRIEKAVDALVSAGISKEDIIETNSLKDVNFYLEKGKFVVSENIELATKANIVDAVVDATGVPEVGANVALNAIDNGKHIIMLTVETDAVVGPILYKKAKENGVVYTGTAGDEPGATMELYNFAVGLGFDVLVIGKGKNNPLNVYATPDMVSEEAKKKELKPNMLAEFVDGTNTMIELTSLANATGFVPDVRGCHGVESDLKSLTNILSLKEEGGVLNSYKAVEFVKGIAPGVFAIITTNSEEVHKQLQYLSMGPGPNYVLYRPYHLTCLETPLTIFEACFYKEATIAPTKGQVADTVAVAKKDLKAGDRLDYIGGYTVYGTIEKHDIAMKENLLPIGLIDENTIVKRDIKKGELITYDMVELNKDKTIYKLRRLQDETIG